MPLDDRRLAMLREMGVPFWQPLLRAGAMPVTNLPPETPQGFAAPPTAPPTAPVPAVARPAPREGAVAPPARAAASAPPADVAAPWAPASDVRSLDWPALREAVAGCRACGLCEKRRQTVFGVGHPRAHWMVVGEAPGEQEDLRGEPFTGPAGRLLDQMLGALGLTRAETAAEDASGTSSGTPSGTVAGTFAEKAAALTPARQVYIANTLKCRPPGNRNPEPAELAKCEPFLVRQIELVRPRVILAMGRFAVQALLRTDEPLGRLRGRVHRYQGVPLIVTYHPAYLLRNLLDKAKAWDDLCLAKDTMDGLEHEDPA
jgi:DNA polymerase